MMYYNITLETLPQDDELKAMHSTFQVHGTKIRKEQDLYDYAISFIFM